MHAAGNHASSNNPDSLVIGVDVGGSGIRAAAVDQGGRVVGTIHRMDSTDPNPQQVLTAIHQMVEKATPASGTILSVGVGIPAFLRQPGGIVDQSPNLRRLDGWKAGSEIAAALSLPVVVANDADAAAYGEAWQGSEAVGPLVYLGLGTGLGGGIVIDGHPLHGAWGMAAELGHLTVFADGAECGCGAVGCVEAYASAVGLLRSFNRATDALSDAEFINRYGDRAGLTAERLYSIAQQGDSNAVAVFALAGRALGIAICQLLHTVNPRVVVIGGQVAGAWPLFEPQMIAAIQRHSSAPLRDGVTIRRAVLAADSGLIGAAGLAWQGLGAA